MSALTAYLKQESNKSFKDWTKEGLTHLLSCNYSELIDSDKEMISNRLEIM